MMIDRYTHRKQEAALIEAWEAKFRAGKDLALGRTYRAVVTRDGTVRHGPFLAAAYARGRLMLVKKRYYVFLDCDAAEVNGTVFTEEIAGAVNIGISPEALTREWRTDGEAIRRLRLACTRKFACLLSEDSARMILRWWKEQMGKGTKPRLGRPAGRSGGTA